MLLLISAITLNAWAEDEFHQEWRRINTELNIDELMKGGEEDGNVIDLRNQTHKGIDPDTLGSSHTATANVEHSVKNKRPQELQSQGRASMRSNQEVTNLLGDLQKNTDRSEPGVDNVFRKADKIVEQRANMGDTLSQYLKEKYDIDIGCTSTQGSQNSIDNPFIIGEEVQEIRNEVYEPQYCEHLLNTYDCTTDLHINCIKRGQKALQLDIKEANFGYHQEGNLVHINHHYHNEIFSSYYGKSLDTYHFLGTTEVRLVFNIQNLEIFNSLVLTNINFSHAILIQFNGHKLYPNHWTDLKAESATPWSSRTTNLGKRYSMGSTRHSGGSIIYNDMYPHLDHGSGIIILNFHTRSDNHIENIDLTRFIRPGHNELIIKGGSIGNNYIRAVLRSFENTCLKWSEKWVETCTLQPS